MAFFHIYADESGKLSGRSDYTSLCGYVGAAMEWQKVSYQWQQCCLKWGVPPIHMSKILREPVPDEIGWAKIASDWGINWTGRRNQMLEEFASIIFHSNIVAIGTVIDAREYRKIQSSGKYKFPIDDSNVFLLQELLTWALDRVEVVDRSSPVSLIVDNDYDTAFNYYSMLKALKENSSSPKFARIRDRVSGICFSNDCAYPGLQMADMIAYESRNLMVRRIKEPNSEPSELYRLLTHNGVNQTKLLDAEWLKKVANECAQRTEKSEGHGSQSEI